MWSKRRRRFAKRFDLHQHMVDRAFWEIEERFGDAISRAVDQYLIYGKSSIDIDVKPIAEELLEILQKL